VQEKGIDREGKVQESISTVRKKKILSAIQRESMQERKEPRERERERDSAANL